MMPEKTLKKLNHCILPQWKTCFFAALLVGLVAHLYKITGWIPNWDSLVFRYDSQNMLKIGRWFLPVVCSFSSFYDLPLLNGLIAILFHAMSAVCICKMFRVQKKVSAAFIGAMVVSFPTVISVMMYNYVADGYSIAFFFSALAALCLTKEKPRYILSTVLIALSTGIYQAYITVTVMLVLFYLIDELLFQNASVGVVLKKALLALLSGVLGMVIYSVVLKLLLGIFSVELLDYQGVSATASLSDINLFASLYIVKETFRKCFFDLSGGVNLYVVLNGLVFLFTLGYYLKSIVVHKIYKKPANLLMLIVLGGMLFFGAGALAFINPGIDYHNLMLMGYCVFYLMFLMIYERGQETKEKHTAIRCWTVFLIALVMISNQVVMANVSYHKAQMAYEKSYGVLVRIADRMEQLPEIENCDKILVIGALDNSEAYSVNLTPEITGITDGYIIRADDEIVGQSVFCSTLNDYCGTNYQFLSGDAKQKIMEREDVQAMKKWPSRECLAIVEDVVVLKLGTEGVN
ncbi:MAG: hypothetical protein E7413_04270 [Ruminococcaceae bacterium]|nr:hypothetical protein [Oscillospiraceae bacterium]